MGGQARQLAIYCADIGSIRGETFGWARVDEDGGRERRGARIEELADELVEDLVSQRPVALGLECPLFAPVPEDAQELGRQREGERGSPWVLGAGATTLAFGLVEGAWLLREVRARVDDVHADTAWDNLEGDGARLVLWEALVTRRAKAPDKTTRAMPRSRARHFADVSPTPPPTSSRSRGSPLRAQFFCGAAWRLTPVSSTTHPWWFAPLISTRLPVDRPAHSRIASPADPRKGPVVGIDLFQPKLAIPDLAPQLPPPAQPGASDEEVAQAQEDLTKAVNDLSRRALTANSENLTRSLGFMNSSFDWVKGTYAVTLAFAFSLFGAAIVGVLGADGGGEAVGSALLAFGGAGVVIAAFYLKPVESMERNAVYVPWLILVLNTYWTRLAYMNDPSKIDQQLEDAATDAVAQFKLIADSHSAALTLEKDRFGALGSKDDQTGNAGAGGTATGGAAGSGGTAGGTAAPQPGAADDATAGPASAGDAAR